MQVRKLGVVDYLVTLQAMKDFTDQRDAATEDELWLLQHPAVFTQGQAGKAVHVLTPGDIPVVQADRGGQVTYHGPGQWVIYMLVDLRRHSLGVRDLVDAIEQSIVRVLATLNIDAAPRRDAPGVYVGAAKIAALGLRVRRGCSYHGLAFNMDMDLEPFSRINPCGYAGLQVTDLRRCLAPGVTFDPQEIGDRLLFELTAALGCEPSAPGG
jgi:lipoyl(octanoyl) transferase